MLIFFKLERVTYLFLDDNNFMIIEWNDDLIKKILAFYKEGSYSASRASL